MVDLFLGVETAWYVGLETFAKRYDAEVVYTCKKKVAWSCQDEFIPVTDGGRCCSRGEVYKCIGLLEKEIESAPGDWLL